VVVEVSEGVCDPRSIGIGAAVSGGVRYPRASLRCPPRARCSYAGSSVGAWVNRSPEAAGQLAVVLLAGASRG